MTVVPVTPTPNSAEKRNEEGSPLRLVEGEAAGRSGGITGRCSRLAATGLFTTAQTLALAANEHDGGMVPVVVGLVPGWWVRIL